MFAIINHNGTQIKVSENKEYKIPYFDCKEGDKIKFDQVLLIDSDKTEVGQPVVEGASVEGTITGIGQSDKISVIKFHSKKRYKKIGSHRQDFVSVKIDKIKLK
jgi:large subunit ribosomal protein L21